jgi:transposase
MTRTPSSKEDALARHGTVNPHPEAVTDPRFLREEFFDPRDLVQVRYEMVRRVEVEGDAVIAAVRAFGCSRTTFYKAREALEETGLVGLLPKKRGPRRGHKMKGAVLEAVLEAGSEDAGVSAEQIADMVRRRFGVSVHPRTIRRALARQKKKRP